MVRRRGAVRPSGRRVAEVVTLTAVITCAAARLSAQTLADGRKGLEFARAHCAGCHAVEAGNRRSINPAAPAFAVIAAWPGMSERALHAALQSSHRRMPDIVLPSGERANVIAYILGLTPVRESP